MGRGEYLEKDAEGAWMLLIKTLKTDHAAAKIKAALEFLPGGVGPENPKRTKKVLQGLIDEGNSAAMIAYAMKVLNLQKAEIGSDSSKQGISLLERAALEKNDSQAAIYLSLLFNQGNVVRRDEGKAIEFAQLAIDAGVTRAYGTMGQIFQNQSDMKSAVKWFQKGAEKGDGFSQGMLGFMYSGGFGVEQDLEKAVHFEITRQQSLVERKIEIIQETRHWDDGRKITVSARTKEEEAEYRYHLEADIPWIRINDDTKNQLQVHMPESISSKKERYVSKYGITPQVAGILSSDRYFSELFENAKNETNAKDVANMITTDIMGLLDTREKRDSSKLNAEHLSALIESIKSSKITRTSAKLALDEIIKNGKPLQQIIDSLDESGVNG